MDYQHTTDIVILKLESVILENDCWIEFDKKCIGLDTDSFAATNLKLISHRAQSWWHEDTRRDINVIGSDIAFSGKG